MVKITVNAAPITTIYTPVSNSKGVPSLPITGICPFIHKACISGFPTKKGDTAAKKQELKPMGKRDLGSNLIIDFVLSNPLANASNTKALAATKPPINPPPGS